MEWHSIYIGPTTTALRQQMARRSEFFLGEEHERVLGLFGDRAGFMVHPSELVKLYGWPRYRAIRVLEEIADAFALPRVPVSSPHGEATVYQWGRVIQSSSWPVNGESYSPVSSRDSSTDSVPASAPAPAPAPVPAAEDDVELAAQMALDGTKMSSMDAARGMIRWGMKAHGMSAQETATALIHLSSTGQATTRASLAQYVAPPAEPAAPEPEDMVTAGNSAQRVQLNEVAAAHPELGDIVAVLGAVLDHQYLPRTDASSLDDWHQHLRAVVGDYSPADIYPVVAAMGQARRRITRYTLADAIAASRRVRVAV